MADMFTKEVVWPTSNPNMYYSLKITQYAWSIAVDGTACMDIRIELGAKLGIYDIWYRSWNGKLFCNSEQRAGTSGVKEITRNGLAQSAGYFQTETFRIYPNTDGSYTMKIAAEGMFLQSGNETIYVQKQDFIYDAEAYNKASVPTLSSSTAAVGSKLTISTNRNNSQLTHTLKFTAGGQTVTIATGVTERYEWTIPNSVAKMQPSLAMFNGSIACETYNGTSLLGTNSVSVTITVPDNDSTKPSMDIDSDILTDLPAVFDGMIVQGKTKIAVTFNASSSCSNIAKQVITVDGNTYNAVDGVATSDEIGSSGAVTVMATVTDTRGYSRSQSIMLSVTEYSAPKLVNIDCARCDASGADQSAGAYIRLSFSTVVSSVDGKNTGTTTMRWKSGNSSYTAEQSVTGAQRILADIATDAESTYQVQLIIRDTIGSEQRYTMDLASAFHTMHLKSGGRGVAFGKRAERDGLDVNMMAFFRAGFGGEAITEGSDLNESRHVGKYLVTHSTVNSPTDDAGSLYVMAAYDPTVQTITGANQHLIQIFLSKEAEVYIRPIHSDSTGSITVGDWKQIV